MTWPVDPKDLDMEFISRHSDVINALANIATFLVWLIYAQLLYMNFVRQRKSRIMINQIQGYGLDSHCIISNMSREPIHIECILIAARSGNQTLHFNVSEKPRHKNNGSVDDNDIRKLTLQGPLEPSGYISIGKFGDLLANFFQKDHLFSGDGNHTDDHVKSIIEVKAIVTHGPETHPMGVHRPFILEKTGREQIRVYPQNLYTRQVSGLRAKYFIIPKWFGYCWKK